MHPRPVSRRPIRRRASNLGSLSTSPFRTGFWFVLGGAAAVGVAVGMLRLGGVMTWVGLAVFVALGCDPVVRWLIRRGLSRSQAVPVVVAGGGLLIAGVVALVVPTVLAQLRKFITDAPQLVASIGEQAWLEHLQSLLPASVNVEVLLEQGQHALTRPAVLEKLTSGAVSTGIGVFGTVSAIVTIGVLALCLLATLPQAGAGVLALVPARSRTLVRSLGSEIAASTGRYVGGMLLLAALNAGLGFVVMLIVGVPFAPAVAVIVFFVALIPLVGSVLATILTVLVGLTAGPSTAIAIGVYYLVYMQVEAYVLTPRVMGKVLAVPVLLIIIGALVGGSLLGLTGALVAMPVTTASLLIIRRVVIPAQNAKQH